MNLSNYSTFIVDSKPTSEYFRISEFKETLSGGKNGFLIEGSEYLKETTEIKIEILDVEGNPIYFEPGNGIPEYYEGISKLISVHVYDDTPIGVGKITILGELKNYIAPNGILTPVPSEWKNTYNVKWEKTFSVNKNLPNEDIVRFYKRPIISIDEIVKPIFSKVTPSVTQTGSLQGISQTPINGSDLTTWRAGTIYKLKITDDSNFTSSIDENVINIPSLGYSPTVKEVLNNKEVLVDIPYSINNIVANFDSVGYTSSFEYVEGQTVSDSSLTGSFAKIDIQQLKTFVGDVARVKIYRKSRNEVGDFQFVQESKLEASELLRDVTTTADTEISYGNFTDSNLSTYWVSSSNDHPLTIDVEKLNASVKVDYNTTLGGVQQLITSESFSISKDVEYTISFKTLLSGSLDGSKTIKAYLSSSDYQQTFLTVSGSDTYKTRQTVSQNILATNSSDAKLVFEFEGGDWYVSNVSLQNAQETSFSPDEFILIQDVPRKLASETFDYRFEFYDINNNYIPVDVLGSHTFTGGNNFPTNNKLLTFESDRTAFRFSTGSVQNPPNQQIKFTLTQNNLTGSVTYASSAFDVQGNFLNPNEYSKYPGELTSVTPAGAVLTANNFTGSRVDGFPTPFVGSIVYTASIDDLVEYETVYRLEDGENAPGLFVTSDANQFIYKATDLSPNPSDQKITILAKRKNLASSITPIIVNGIGSSPSLTELGTNSGTGITSYSLDITDFNYSIPAPSASYFFTASDEWGNLQYDTVTISQVKVLDGLSVSLTNENATLPALSTGFVASGSFVFTSGSVSVKVGSEDITRQEGLSTNNRWDIISATGTACTPNDIAPTDSTYGITSLSSDSASLQLVVRYKDGGGDTTDVTKIVTYSKAKKSAPLLNFVIGNGNQTVTAKSTGAQIDSFVNVSFAVNETYNGLTSTKTFTPTSITATNSYFTGSTTSTSMVLPNMANGTDSVDLSITGSVVDSENTTRFVYGNVSLAKTKKAVPNVVLSATPQSQTVSANPAGTQTGTLTNVSVTAVEGSTDRFTSMVIAGTSGFSTLPTVSGSTLTMTAAVMNSDEASVTLTVTHTDSEGTTGQTKTIIIRASKIKQGESGVVVNLNPASQVVTVSNTLAYGAPTSFVVSVIEGSTTYAYDASAPYAASTFRISGLISGSNSNGTITPTTPNSVAGTTTTFNVIYTNTSGVEVTIPSSHKVSVTLDGQTGPGVVSTGVWAVNRAYQFSTGAGTGRRDVVLWSTTGNAPYDTYYATKRAHTSAAGNVIDGAPHQPLSLNTTWESLGTQDFFVAAKIGLFEDSYVQSTLNIGTNNNGGVATANITLAGGTAYPYFSLGQSSAGVYNADGIFIGAVSDSGTKYKLSLKGTGGSLTWDGNNLNIVGGGTFSGALSAASGTFTGALQGGTISIGSNDSIFKADTNGIYLGNATFASAPFRVTPAGVLTATSATIAGTVTADAGKVGGWNIDSNSIYSGTKDTSGYSTTGITLYSSGSIHSPNFYIDTSGGAYFKGNVTGGSIAIGSNFLVDTAGNVSATNASLSGTVNATAGNIGGWSIEANGLLQNSTGKLKINPSIPAIEIYDSTNVKRLNIHYGSLSQLDGSGTITINQTTTTLSPITHTSPTFYRTYGTGIPVSVNTIGTYAGSVTWASGGSPMFVNANNNFGTSVAVSRGIEFRTGGGDVIGRIEGPSDGVNPQYAAPDETITLPSVTETENIYITASGTVYAYAYYMVSITTLGTYPNFSDPATVTIYNTTFTQPSFTLALQSSIVEISDGGIQIAKDANNYIQFSRDLGAHILSATGISRFAGSTVGYCAEIYNYKTGGMGVEIDVATSDDTAIYVKTGKVYKPLGGSWLATSDYRIKKNIQDFSGSLDLLGQFKPRTFEWVNPDDKGTGGSEIQIGFIAQEVEDVYPNWVSEIMLESGSSDIELVDPDFEEVGEYNRPKVKAIGFNNDFNAIVISAIQELSNKVDTLESKIIELEAKISGSV